MQNNNMESIIPQKIAESMEKLISVDTLELKPDPLLLKPNLFSFPGTYENFCVGMVDIVNSTKITARLTTAKAGKYYSIFLNSMASVISQFGGKVIKNVGDSLLYYFRLQKERSAASALECGMRMLDERTSLNILMKYEDLPQVNYRVSYDYGMVTIAEEMNSGRQDIFGPPVNMCSKINRCAKSNEMVVGGDMFVISKSTKTYMFKEVKTCPSDFKFPYPVYTVQRHLDKML
jgi:class 3 adenylate cyclase